VIFPKTAPLFRAPEFGQRNFLQSPEYAGLQL
jgi:hypothetical protein